MKQYIKDSDGDLIEVTDLGEAILHVAWYLGYLYDQSTPEQKAFAQKRQKYWKDVFVKLNLLKQEHNIIENINENDEITDSIYGRGKSKAIARAFS
jgi:hypothetical protein